MKKQPENVRHACIYDPKDNSLFYPKNNSTTYYPGLVYDKSAKIFRDKSGPVSYLDEDNFLCHQYLCEFDQILTDLEKKKIDTNCLKFVVKEDLEFIASAPKELDKINTELKKLLEQKPFDFSYLLKYVLSVGGRVFDKQKKICDAMINKSKTQSASHKKSEIYEKDLRRPQKVILKGKPLRKDDSRTTVEDEIILVSDLERFEQIYARELELAFEGKRKITWKQKYPDIKRLQDGDSAFMERYDFWRESAYGIAFMDKWNNDSYSKMITKIIEEHKSDVKSGTEWWRNGLPTFNDK